MGEIEKIETAIKKLIKEYEENYLIFVSEADVVATLAEKLKKELNESVGITADAFTQSGVREKFDTGRIHLEVDYPAAKKKKGRKPKIDIAVLKNKKVKLEGYVYKEKTPSTTFPYEDILAAIEVKLWRSPDMELRKSEKNNMERTINILKNFKNKNVWGALVILHHYSCRELIEQIRKQCKQGRVKFFENEKALQVFK